MTSVELLETQIGRLTVPVGRIDFRVLPVKKENDFEAVPSSIVSFAEAHAISIELLRNSVQGSVGWYQWREIT
jgi:hypothetical protein